MNKGSFAPIVIFAYNRADKIENCIRSLKKSKGFDESDIFIYADGGKNSEDCIKVKQVQDYLLKFKEDEEQRNKTINVIISNENKGLANSVIDGVTFVINKYGRAIVVEDDLVVSGHFISYMNEALDYYENEDNVWSISGYIEDLKSLKYYDHDVFYYYRGCSWGWATWKDRWETVDWEVSDYEKLLNNKRLKKRFNRGGNDLTPMLINQMEGKIDSWAVRWCFAESIQDKYTVYPKWTHVNNMGSDGSGTHQKSSGDAFNSLLSENTIRFEVLKPDKKINRELYMKYSDSLRKKIKRNLSYRGVKKCLMRFLRFEKKEA